MFPVTLLSNPRHPLILPQLYSAPLLVKATKIIENRKKERGEQNMITTSAARGAGIFYRKLIGYA